MKSRPNLLTLALVVLAIGFERFAYYGARSVMTLHLIDQGMPRVNASELFRYTATLSLFTPLLGGLLALGVGARITAVVGAVIALLGYGLLVVGAPASLCMVVIVVGAGIFRPCPWAIAAEEVAEEASPTGADPANAPKSGRRFAAMAAMACVLYASINLAAMTSSMVMASVRRTWGTSPAFVLATLAVIACAICAGIVLFLGGGGVAKAAIAAPDPYRAPGAVPQRAPRPTTGLALAGLALLLVIEVPYSVASSLSFFAGEMLRASGNRAPGAMEILDLLNPIVVVFASVLAFTLFLVATLQRWSTPPLLLYGAGVVVFAVGLVPLIFTGDSIALFVLGTGITAIGEALVAPVALAYAALAADGRSRAIVIAGWMLLANGGSHISHAMHAELGLRPVLGALALILLIAGVATLAIGRTVHRTLFDPAT